MTTEGRNTLRFEMRIKSMITPVRAGFRLYAHFLLTKSGRRHVHLLGPLLGALDPQLETPGHSGSSPHSHQAPLAAGLCAPSGLPSFLGPPIPRRRNLVPPGASLIQIQ